MPERLSYQGLDGRCLPSPKIHQCPIEILGNAYKMHFVINQIIGWALTMQNFNTHAPWRIVHAAIAGLIAMKGIIVAALMLSLGVVSA
ncbi:MAG TPA: hypothetical protein ENO16_00450 [Chromatiales bacterium]|nr:hypothetical protein [Chromatiales bacterium]